MSKDTLYSKSIPEKNNSIIPDFLDTEFFETNLNHEYKNMKINKIDIIMGSNIGENYFSVVYRALLFIEYEDNKHMVVSLIIKYLPIEGRRQFGETLNIHDKELEMYINVIPKLNELLNNTEILAPKYYNNTPDPNRTIILKDIKSLGFSLANRQEGLDNDHATLVIRKIAKFHAASMVLAEQHPELMETFHTGFFHENNRDSSLQKNIFEGNIEYIIKIISNWEGFEEIAIKLLKIKETFMDKCLENVKITDKTIKVLNHGDLHINNFMFKYDKRNEVTDVIFFDYQMSHYASLALDIQYFFNTSLHLQVLKKNQIDLLRKYYSTLVLTLNKLNYENIPTWDDILKEMSTHELYGFFAFEGILPTISMNQNDCKFNNIDQYSSDDILNKRRKIMFASERMLQTVQFCLKRFNRLGVLD